MPKISSTSDRRRSGVGDNVPTTVQGKNNFLDQRTVNQYKGAASASAAPVPPVTKKSVPPKVSPQPTFKKSATPKVSVKAKAKTHKAKGR